MKQRPSRGPSDAAGGRPSWTPAEGDLAILSALADGQTIDVVARRQGVSERTIRRRLRTIAVGFCLGSFLRHQLCPLAIRRSTGATRQIHKLTIIVKIKLDDLSQ